MKKHFTSYILITILGGVINAQYSFSQTSISLSNGAALSYQSGNIDLSDYRGEMNDVIYHPPDGGMLTAETITIQTEKHTQDGNSKTNKTIYKLVEINKGKIASIQEQYHLSADLIELRDFPHSLVAQLLEIGGDDNLSWDIKTASPKLELLDVDFSGNGIIAEAKEIKGSITPILNNPANSPRLVNFELMLENSDIIPVGDSELATRLTSILSDLELQKLTLSLLAKSQFLQINNIQQIGLSLTARQLFSVAITLYIEYPVLENLTELEESELAIMLLQNIKLHKIEIELEDFGLNARLPNTRLNEYHSSAKKLQNLVLAIMPANGQRLTTPIMQFVYNGGTLTLTSQPSTPKPVALIASMLLFPDLLVKEFAISSEHHP
ncbi:hypothetical protein OAS27_02325 [Alphaproteobacteria bacterium]|nr:hypothetical protein [Alphaproteobacteria bacterium]